MRPGLLRPLVKEVVRRVTLSVLRAVALAHVFQRSGRSWLTRSVELKAVSPVGPCQLDEVMGFRKSGFTVRPQTSSVTMPSGQVAFAVPLRGVIPDCDKAAADAAAVGGPRQCNGAVNRFARPNRPTANKGPWSIVSWTLFHVSQTSAWMRLAMGQTVRPGPAHLTAFRRVFAKAV